MYGEAPIRCIDTRIVDSETIFPALVPSVPYYHQVPGFLLSLYYIYVPSSLRAINHLHLPLPARYASPHRQDVSVKYFIRTAHRTPQH